MVHTVYLSLGSNIGDRERYLRDAISRLERFGRVVAVSSLYETEPVEVTDQAWFMNCVAELETSETPAQLIADILELERKMGRKRVQNKGPRTIDIDILLFDDMSLDTPELSVPHPAMAARRFVLEPLAEIAPHVMHPVLQKTAQELLEGLPSGQAVRRITSRSNG